MHEPKYEPNTTFVLPGTGVSLFHVPLIRAHSGTTRNWITLDHLHLTKSGDDIELQFVSWRDSYGLRDQMSTIERQLAITLQGNVASVYTDPRSPAYRESEVTFRISKSNLPAVAAALTQVTLDDGANPVLDPLTQQALKDGARLAVESHKRINGWVPAEKLRKLAGLTPRPS